MEKSKSKIVGIVEAVYVLIKYSIQFCLDFAKGLFVYGIVKASYNLIFALKQGEGLEEREDDFHFSNVSFIWFLSLSSLIGILFQYLVNGLIVSPLFLSIIITFFVFIHLYQLVLVLTLMDDNNRHNKTWYLAKTLDNMIRTPGKQLAFLSLSLFSILIGFWNLVLLIFLIPSSTAYLVLKIWEHPNEE